MRRRSVDPLPYLGKRMRFLDNLEVVCFYETNVKILKDITESNKFVVVNQVSLVEGKPEGSPTPYGTS